MNIIHFIKQLLGIYPKRPTNTGVLMGRKNTDYIVGFTSLIPYRERLKDGNWTPYCFDEELQWSSGGDSMSCVSHSAVNIIQAQEFFLTGKKVNYSKRWLAKMSGTTKQGNYLYKVADAIREFGLVLEEDYPAPETYTWEQYHADIPAAKLKELKVKGQEWLKKWQLQYEWLELTDPNLDYHLKHSPIQVIVPGHATTGIYSPDQYMTYFDSYQPWIKKYSVAGLQGAMKLILNRRTIVSRRVKFKGDPEVWHILPNDTMERLRYFDQNIPILFPDYSVDDNQIYELPVKKPNW